MRSPIMTLWRITQFSITLALAASLPAVPAFAQPAAAATTSTAEAVERRPVLVISIDGMRPDAVLDADRHGLKIPVLRSLLAKGSYAQNVKNVNPTVTNPNHTTLMTDRKSTRLNSSH